MMRILVVEDEKLLCDGIAEDVKGRIGPGGVFWLNLRRKQHRVGSRFLVWGGHDLCLGHQDLYDDRRRADQRRPGNQG